MHEWFPFNQVCICVPGFLRFLNQLNYRDFRSAIKAKRQNRGSQAAIGIQGEAVVYPVQSGRINL